MSSEPDEDTLCPRQFYGDLRTPDARALHELRVQEFVERHLEGSCMFLSERVPLGHHHLREGHGGRALERNAFERYGVPQVLTPAA